MEINSLRAHFNTFVAKMSPQIPNTMPSVQAIIVPYSTYVNQSL